MFFLRTFISHSRLRLTNVYPLLHSSVIKRLQSTNKHGLTPSDRKGSEVNVDVKPLSEKVKETTKTTTNFAVILIGIGVTGMLFYTVFSELFSSTSPNNVYSKAAEKCIENTEVSDKLGHPINVYGKQTRRGRRQHVSHVVYLDRNGKKHLRMEFHLKGSVNSGTAHLDMIENESGKYDYFYLFVEVDDMFRNVIVLEDNRNNLNNFSLM